MFFLCVCVCGSKMKFVALDHKHLAPMNRNHCAQWKTEGTNLFEQLANSRQCEENRGMRGVSHSSIPRIHLSSLLLFLWCESSPHYQTTVSNPLALLLAKLPNGEGLGLAKHSLLVVGWAKEDALGLGIIVEISHISLSIVNFYIFHFSCPGVSS